MLDNDDTKRSRHKTHRFVFAESTRRGSSVAQDIESIPTSFASKTTRNARRSKTRGGKNACHRGRSIDSLVGNRKKPRKHQGCARSVGGHQKLGRGKHCFHGRVDETGRVFQRTESSRMQMSYASTRKPTTVGGSFAR